MVLALKATHLAMLLVWCAALLALPVMLRWREPAAEPAAADRHDRLRRLTQGTYTRLATPAAVIAIAAGTALLFVRSVFEPWMFAKLVLVAVLVALHVRLGLLLERLGHRADNAVAHTPTWQTLWVAVGAAVSIALVLLLVLAKPAPPADVWPAWLLTPRGQPMPVAEPPKR